MVAIIEVLSLRTASARYFVSVPTATIPTFMRLLVLPMVKHLLAHSFRVVMEIFTVSWRTAEHSTMGFYFGSASMVSTVIYIRLRVFPATDLSQMPQGCKASTAIFME